MIRRFYLILLSNKTSLISTVVLLFWLAVATLPFIFPSLNIENYSPNLADRLQSPNSEYFFGTDSQGNNLIILLINGAKTSLLVSVTTVLFCLLLGIPLGAISGYFGGKIDALISRVIDILLAFPPLILPIAITSFYGSGFFNVILALSVTGWVSYARLVRGQFLQLKQREFVLAAQALGATNKRIIFKHILPNAISPIAIQATFAIAGVIISEAGLSFLGLGVSGGNISWGAILNDARLHLTEAPFLAFIPGFTLFSVVCSLNFLGENLRLSLDPKSSTNIERV